MKNLILGIGVLHVVSCSTPGINANAASGGQGASNGGGGSGGAGAVKFIVKDDAGPGGPGAADADGDGKVCGMQKFNLQKLPPEVMVVLDRSGSMQAAVGAGVVKTTRWEEVTGALDPSVMMTQAVVSWGLKVFPTDSAVDICGVLDPVEVAVAGSNYAAVSAAITAAVPIPDVGGTPTRKGIESSVAYLKTLTTPNPKYMLLATDGEPNCPPGGSANQTDDDGAVAALKSAAAEGFHTFVVGIATAGTKANGVLNDMAKAGGEPRNATPQYYPVANKNDLATALGMITKRISSCTFPLTEKPPSPDDVAVNIGGMRVPRDTTEKNGWNYNEGMKSIDVFGAWCDMLKDSKADMLKVDIIFGCPFIPIP